MSTFKGRPSKLVSLIVYLLLKPYGRKISSANSQTNEFSLIILLFLETKINNSKSCLCTIRSYNSAWSIINLSFSATLVMCLDFVCRNIFSFYNLYNNKIIFFIIVGGLHTKFTNNHHHEPFNIILIISSSIFNQ